ncbi:uncharacterized protein E0L32_004155 [Thyridium curvatum]|uniref:1-alkyl-2-acetylglycerophosphocholine esterase n=1 Tax=Thyridium curvatum TaxID=1093900 RepID=A0A507BHW9_9PEZI|nr:uncharacterized protein E0L32_004155 [Thyridium curvatum]TPX16160.1 hypothetical protein E0L32_004155 [Thyridium curvatum]
MDFPNPALIGDAAKLPTSPSVGPVISYDAVVLPCPDRALDLEVKVTFPAAAAAGAEKKLPVILLSHGHGPSNYLSSQQGYVPVARFWASRGFAVLQPTHLSSRNAALPLDPATMRHNWLDSRARDMSRVLDRLGELEAGVPALGSGRLDRDRVAVAGHSLGGFTAALLLGAVNTDPRDGAASRLADPRVKAGILIGTGGSAGADGANLSDSGRRMVPFYGTEFAEMRAPALVVWGEDDVSQHLTTRGADWHREPYELAPGPKDAFMVKGGLHGFGGISGWDAKECQDESPERLAAFQRLTTAWLRSQLYEGDQSWKETVEAVKGFESSLGKIESKGY